MKIGNGNEPDGNVNLLEDQSRLERLKKGLVPCIRETRELPGGYAFLISGYPTAISTMVQLLSLEDPSCRLFRISLGETTDDNAAWVHFTGHSCVKEFLRSQLVND